MKIIIFTSLLLLTACQNPYKASYSRLAENNGILDQYINYVHKDKTISKDLKQSRLSYAQALKLKAERITNEN